MKKYNADAMDDDLRRLPREYRELAELRSIAQVHRSRNGRLQLNWLSRRALPRYKMLALDGQWYDRRRLRDRLRSDRAAGRRLVVPHSARALTAAELAAVADVNPWSLAPR